MRLRGFAAIVTAFVAVLLISAPGGPVPSQRALAATVVAGDSNCDGQVNALDVTAGLQAISGMVPGCAAARGDLDCSGAAGLDDLILLRRFLAGLPISQPEGCPPVGSAREVLPTAALIEQALASGELTKGQALLYHLYADLTPGALPPKFQGGRDDHAHLESTIFHEIAVHWAQLSPGEKAAIQPFLLPPATPGSWYEGGAPGIEHPATSTWETAGSDRIKVWWRSNRPEDAAKAAAILDEVDTYIWPEVVGYMGASRAPISDAGYQGSGGDGRYDIYLVHNESDDPGHKPVLGWVSPHLNAAGDAACEMTPTYMVVNSRGALSQDLLATAAHEFMHSVQFTYDVGNCDDYRWLMESTAVWVESWLYPEVNSEHGYAPSYLEALGTPLETWIYKDPRQYGSYLLWYHAQHNEHLFHAVRDTWNASGHPDSLVAVNAGLAGAGGLKKVWPESALYNWNLPPYDDFLVLDQLFAGPPRNETEVIAPTRSSKSYAVPTDVGHMQQRHLPYHIDESVKTLTFLNPFPASFEDEVKVQALLMINGLWEPEARDWTDLSRISFCREKPEEKVDKVVIIITNSTFTDRTHKFEVGPGELVASPHGCKGWTGSASAEIPYFDTTFRVTVDNMRFSLKPDQEPGQRYVAYELVEASPVTWHVSGVWPNGCIPSGSMTLTPPKSGPDEVRGTIVIDTEENDYTIIVNGSMIGATFTITCEDGSWEQPWPVISVIWSGGPDVPMKDEGDQLVLDYVHIEPFPAYGGTWNWRFTEVQ